MWDDIAPNEKTPPEKRFSGESLEACKAILKSKVARLGEITKMDFRDVTKEIMVETDQLGEDLKLLKSEIDEKRTTDDVPVALQIMQGKQAVNRSTEGQKMITQTNNRSFRSMFYQGRTNELDNGGFKDDIEFFNVLMSGRFDPRLQERAMVENIPSAGGFSSPNQFAADWLDASLPNEITRNLAKIYPMKGETLLVPGWAANDFSSGEYAGLKMNFLAESTAADKQNAKMRQIQLNAHMGTIYVDVSLELVADGKGFAEQLRTAMVKALGYGIDRHCVGSAGTGAGSPLSILNSPCKIEIAGESGQANSTINYQNIKKVFSRQLDPQKSVWLINPNTVPEILELSIVGGTSSSHVPVMNEANGTFTILGRPVYLTSHVPALGSAACVAFVNFDYYALGMRQDVILDTTDSHRWTQRERSFRVLIRFDGQCTLDTYITPENGDTLSPVVTLAAI